MSGLPPLMIILANDLLKKSDIITIHILQSKFNAIPVICLQHGNQSRLEHTESCRHPVDHTRIAPERKSDQPIEEKRKFINYID